MKTMKAKTIPLYPHTTDGGACYLTDKFILCPNGHKEGIFEGAQYVIRLDGPPTLTVKPSQPTPEHIKALRILRNA